MARIVCFADSPTLTQQLKQSLAGSEHDVQVLTASQLNRALRDEVQRFAPELIFIELSRSVDNPHIFFFLRADQSTRDTPIIVCSNSPRTAEEAAILGADGYLPRVFTPAHLEGQVRSLLAQRYHETYTAYAA